MPVVAHASPKRVNIYYSARAHSFWADSPDLDGLAASGKTREEVEHEALLAAETLFEISGAKEPPKLLFRDGELDPE